MIVKYLIRCFIYCNSRFNYLSLAAILPDATVAQSSAPPPQPEYTGIVGEIDAMKSLLNTQTLTAIAEMPTMS